MFFLEKCRRGGGVISDPKNYIADFVGFKAVYFGRKVWKKCPKRGGEGGGHRQSKKNSKKKTIFGETDVPELKCDRRYYDHG